MQKQHTFPSLATQSIRIPFKVKAFENDMCLCVYVYIYTHEQIYLYILQYKNTQMLPLLWCRLYVCTCRICRICILSREYKYILLLKKQLTFDGGLGGLYNVCSFISMKYSMAQYSAHSSVYVDLLLPY